MTKANNLISSITVDYSEISSKTKYSYKGINGNSTKNDVIKILGEPKNYDLPQIATLDIQ